MVWFTALVAASLLWCHCAGEETTPQSTNGHMISTSNRWMNRTSNEAKYAPIRGETFSEDNRMVDSPQKCTTDSDCGDAELLTCDLEMKLCKCREKYSVLSSTGRCLPAKQLGEECEEDAQCQLLERNATCEEKFCACDSGFYMLHDVNGTLCSLEKAIGGAEEAAKAHVDINMIIVIGVLAIMFLGICVALHLFSKARFRNRRTIFNSPHPRLMHIKIGKRKKSSVRTHHLPPPWDREMVPRHHSFSGHHSPFPVERGIQKTRSHECLRSTMSRPSSPRFEPRPKTAPLAEKESLPSNEDLEKKTPEPLQNGQPGFLSEEESQPKAPGSPTVIITDADGAHTVVTSTKSSRGSAVNV